MARQSHKWRVEGRSLPIGGRYNHEKGSSDERDGVRRDASLQSCGLEQAHGWNEGASEEKAVLSARCAVNQAFQASAAKVSGNVIRAELLNERSGSWTCNLGGEDEKGQCNLSGFNELLKAQQEVLLSGGGFAGRRILWRASNVGCCGRARRGCGGARHRGNWILRGLAAVRDQHVSDKAFWQGVSAWRNSECLGGSERKRDRSCLCPPVRSRCRRAILAQLGVRRGP